MSKLFTKEYIYSLALEEEYINQLVMDIDENPDMINEENFPTILCILGTNVLDLRTFICRHPGGPHSILQYTGRDVTKVFNSIHSGRAKEVAKKFIVGYVE